MPLEMSGRSPARLPRIVPFHFTRREALQALGASALSNSVEGYSFGNTSSFWIFGLLRPQRLCISPVGESRVHYAASHGASILEPGGTLLATRESVPLRCFGPEGAPVNFSLEVPGVLRRSYFGTLSVESERGLLVAVLTMDRETAV